jgi:chromatin remodeling complex protein RSC6
MAPGASVDYLESGTGKPRARAIAGNSGPAILLAMDSKAKQLGKYEGGKVWFISGVLRGFGRELASTSMPKTKKKTSKRKPNPAFMRPVQPDDKLAAIVGSQPLPRTELTKKLWNYIKRHGCQDKKKRTMINADDSLRPVFNGKSQVSMFEMTKLVSKHLR